MKSISSNSAKDLFQRISKGDAVAYTIIFNQYFDPLYRNAIKILKSELWAEEIVQDVFLQLWANRQTADAIDAPASYLFKTTLHRCFDRIRRQQLEAKAQYLVNQIMHGPSTIYQQNEYDLNLVKKCIAEAVEQMPPQRRQVFLLRKEKDISYEEIAIELNISRNTVRNHMVKALQDIRSHLQAKGALLFLLLPVFSFLKKN